MLTVLNDLGEDVFARIWIVPDLKYHVAQGFKVLNLRWLITVDKLAVRIESGLESKCISNWFLSLIVLISLAVSSNYIQLELLTGPSFDLVG